MNPYRIGRGPDYKRPPQVTQQGTCGNYATAEHSENKRKKRREASEEAAGSVERKTITHKGGYLKY